MHIYFYMYVYIQDVTQKFWEDDVLIELGKIQAGHLLANLRRAFLMQLGSIACCGPPCRVQGSSPKNSNYLKVFKIKR